MVAVTDKPEVALETVSWQDAVNKHSIPVVSRVGIKPEMLEGEFEQEYGKPGNKDNFNIVYDKDFVVTKLADTLESTGLGTKKELDNLVKDAVALRLKQIEQNKEAKIKDILQSAKSMGLSKDDLEKMFAE